MTHYQTEIKQSILMSTDGFPSDKHLEEITYEDSVHSYAVVVTTQG